MTLQQLQDRRESAKEMQSLCRLAGWPHVAVDYWQAEIKQLDQWIEWLSEKEAH